MNLVTLGGGVLSGGVNLDVLCSVAIITEIWTVLHSPFVFFMVSSTIGYWLGYHRPVCVLLNPISLRCFGPYHCAQQCSIHNTGLAAKGLHAPLGLRCLYHFASQHKGYFGHYRSCHFIDASSRVSKSQAVSVTSDLHVTSPFVSFFRSQG